MSSWFASPVHAVEVRSSEDTQMMYLPEAILEKLPFLNQQRSQADAPLKLDLGAGLAAADVGCLAAQIWGLPERPKDVAAALRVCQLAFMLNCQNDVLNMCTAPICGLIHSDRDMELICSFAKAHHACQELSDLSSSLQQPLLGLPQLEDTYRDAVRHKHDELLAYVEHQLKHWCNRGPAAVDKVAGILGTGVEHHIAGLPLALKFLEAYPSYFAAFSRRLLVLAYKDSEWRWHGAVGLAEWSNTDAEHCISFLRLGIQKYTEGALEVKDVVKFFETALLKSGYVFDETQTLLAKALAGTSHLDEVLKLDATCQAAICHSICRSISAKELLTAKFVEGLTLEAQYTIIPHIHNLQTEAAEALLKAALPGRGCDVEPFVMVSPFEEGMNLA
ncbi:unnamed protein product [Effrenium voratum]|uniref:Uncharacterized protein n=1 Tax=Effrenium voratum TaxID=2562239 RepID=A0AA36NJN7_9DINO|nr:unnamed protein product [Effrenium voratum]